MIFQSIITLSSLLPSSIFTISSMACCTRPSTAILPWQIAAKSVSLETLAIFLDSTIGIWGNSAVIPISRLGWILNKCWRILRVMILRCRISYLTTNQYSGGGPYLFGPSVPLKNINPIMSIWPKGIKVISCHHPLVFKSCRRRWVTKNTWSSVRANTINIINAITLITIMLNGVCVKLLSIFSKVMNIKPITQNNIKRAIYSCLLDLPIVLNQPLNNKLYIFLLLTTKFFFAHQT